MKKQTVVALFLVLLIPMVLLLGGFLFSLINPEIAAGHPNYPRNFHLLTLFKLMLMWGSWAVALALWLLACFLVIRTKERSPLWLTISVLGPIGFAILMTLDDKASADVDRHARFVRSLNIFVRTGYELVRFVIVWQLAYYGMILKRNLMILVQSATTGMSTAQIIDQQNASSGMWAFGEGLEVMYLAVLFYLLWPMVFNLAARLSAMMASPKPD